MNFNPNEPCTVGAEWFPTTRGITPLDANAKAIGLVLEADTADEIEMFWTFLREAENAMSCAIVEVYDITAGLPALPTTSVATYYPGSDRSVGPSPWTPGAWGPFNGWDPSAGGFGPWYEAINSPTLTPYNWTISGQAVDNDEFIFNFFGLGYDFSVGFASTAGTQTGRWVTRVRSFANCAQYLALGAAGAFSIQPYIRDGAHVRPGPSQMVDAAQGVVAVVHDWYYNPITSGPWVGDDIDRFDASYFGSDPLSLGWVVQPTGSSNNLATILQGQLQVESAATDPRLAIGSTMFPPKKSGSNESAYGWKAIRLRDPGTFSPSTITLVPGNRYLFVLRRGGELSNLYPSFIRSPEGVLPGPPNWSSLGVQLDGETLRPTALGETDPATFGSILQISAGTMSLDSQPYMTVSRLGGANDDFRQLGRYYDNSLVNADRSMQQEFTPTATDEYGWLFVLVAQVGLIVDGDLVVTVRDRATDTMQGQPFTITSEDLPEPRNLWRRVGIRMPGAAVSLTAATQYYLDITSTAAANQGWLVQVLNTGTQGATNAISPPAGTPAITYGEGVDQLDTGNPLTTKPGWAACATISTVPDPVEDFAAVAAGPTCCVDHIVLSWEATGIVTCGGFLAYEIERRDDPAGKWQQIAYITDELVNTIGDWESIRNTPAEYRMRVVRGDRSPSDWTATETATASMTGCVGLIFTSNASPDLTVFYQDIPGGQTRNFSFPRNFAAFQPQGANYQVAYWEIPDRGVTFSTKVRLRAGIDPCMPACDDGDGIGMEVFDPIKSITRAGLPYVCIHDEAGNRWFAFVNTPSGSWTQHGIEREGGFAAYTMDLTIMEVTDMPSPFNAVFVPGS